MMVVTAGGMDYRTNAALMMQNEYMLGVITKYPQFLINASGGLLEAMIKDPDGWSVTAITDNLKRQYDEAGMNIWSVDYKLKEENTWRPAAVS
jgi:anaerobic glycerol-3-phosphate dehydrogenase